MNYRSLSDVLRNALLCLGFLGGMGGAVFLFARHQRTAGALTLTAILAARSPQSQSAE